MTSIKYEYSRMPGVPDFKDEELIGYVLNSREFFVSYTKGAIQVFTDKGSITCGSDFLTQNPWVSVFAKSNPIQITKRYIPDLEHGMIDINPERLPFVGELAKYAHYGENYV